MSAAANLLPELIAGRYRVERELARGGMGAVFAAVDESTGRRVAVKRLLANGVQREAIVRLFEREYHTLARLSHPRIIEVYDYGKDEQGPYYAMELLDGADLRDLAPLAYQDACRHLCDVASSLALVHAHGLVHRDLSPRNVRLTSDGRAKLIDFGTLASFGVPTELVGTPPCTAPEAARGASIDQRTDLFGLGALLYWTLTRRHAYPATQLSELVDAWRTVPARPSRLVPGVPAALDELVMSLLALDPMARPSSAAEVIERLSTIAGLEMTEQPQAARGFLASGDVVGRTAELERVRHRLDNAVQGKGSLLAIEAVAGMGRTRLLEELLLHAQLLGIGALLVQGGAHRGRYGTMRALARLALQRLPAGRRIFARRRAVLGDMVPELVQREVGAEPVTASVPPGVVHERAALRKAFTDSFLDLAGEGPLLVLVDDVHEIDEDSLAVLTALARAAPRRRLALVVTRQVREEASVPVNALCNAGGRMKLRALSRADVEKMTLALFGGAPNTGRLTARLYEESAGSPSEVLALAQHLVERGVVRYVDGAWLLPQELSRDALLQTSAEALEGRLVGLSGEARALAEALSVCRRSVAIELCLRLSPSKDEDQTFRALEELVAENVLAGRQDAYQFADEKVRQHLLAGLDTGRKAELHRRVGEALSIEWRKEPVRGLEAGHHLLQGGDESRGADILMNCGAVLVLQNEEGHRVAKALETVLEVYERQGRSVYERLAVLSSLTSLGYYTDKVYGYRHGKRTIDLALEATGMGLAGRTDPATGKVLPIMEGIMAAAARHAGAKAATANRDIPTVWEFRDYFVVLFSAALCFAGTASVCQDAETLRDIVDTMQPVTEMGEHHIASFIHHQCRRMYETNVGHSEEAYRLCNESIARLTSPDLDPDLLRIRDTMLAGNYFALGILQMDHDGDEVLKLAEKIDGTGLASYSTIATQLRLLYHGFRGESVALGKYRDEVDQQAAQGSTTWQIEAFLPAILTLIYTLTGDAVGVKRAWEQTSKLAEEIPSLRSSSDAARAALHGLRGEFDQALSLYERQNSVGLMGSVSKAHLRALSHAVLLVQAKHYERGLEMCREVHQRTSEFDRRSTSFQYYYVYGLAKALMGLGKADEAMDIVDDALRAAQQSTNRLFLGSLNELRAELAFEGGDPEAVQRHLLAAKALYRQTENPLLYARIERLGYVATQAGIIPGYAGGGTDAVTGADRSMVVETVRSALSGCQGLNERAERGLAILVRESGASRGYLFAMKASGPALVARTSPDTPAALFEHVAAKLENYLDSDEETSMASAGGSGIDGGDLLKMESGGESHRILVLSATRQRRIVVVGAVLLEDERGGTVQAPPYDIVEAIASSLYDAGDVASVYLET